jgi:peptidoglycan/xylan/chitin deacetylase (PgdA/CDA1 family)
VARHRFRQDGWHFVYDRVRLPFLVVAAVLTLVSPAFGDRGDTPRSPAGHAANAAPPGAGVQAGVPHPGDPTASAGAPASPGAPPPPSPGTDPSASAKPSASASSRAPRDPNSGPGGSALRTGNETVALTFDDGPDPVNTPLILDELKKYDVKATFCLVGFRVEKHPELVRRMVEEGHTLCNHSWQHLTDLAKKDEGYQRWDMVHTNEAILAAAPGAKIPYFRAPGGNFDTRMVNIAKGYGMKSIYWDYDMRDWDHTKDANDAAHVQRIVNAIQRDTRPGSIVLSHDNGQPTTIQAYRICLPWLKQRFTLAALPQ